MELLEKLDVIIGENYDRYDSTKIRNYAHKFIRYVNSLGCAGSLHYMYSHILQDVILMKFKKPVETHMLNVVARAYRKRLKNLQTKLIYSNNIKQFKYV